jgi:hypothetical protein
MGWLSNIAQTKERITRRQAEVRRKNLRLSRCFRGLGAEAVRQFLNSRKEQELMKLLNGVKGA